MTPSRVQHPWDGWHKGRSWTGHTLEDACPCPQEPCGLVADPDPKCGQHWWEHAKTIRQAHRPEDCPDA